MRFGCCLNMVASGNDGIGAEYLEAVEEMGYDYVELPLAEMMKLNESAFSRLQKKMNQMSITCEACNNFFPGHMKLTGQGAHIDEAVVYAKHALDRACALGVSRVVFGSGPAKNVPCGTSLDKGYWQVVELLRHIAPIAAERQILICIEPLRRMECNLINTFGEGCRLADDAGHPSVKVLIDSYHMTAEGESIENLVKMGRRYLRHVHFSSPDRRFPKKLEEGDYNTLIGALRDISYDERVSCEAYSDDFLTDAPETLRFLRKHLGD